MQIVRTIRKRKGYFITFTAELFKQLPMVVHDHDLRNLGLMTKIEFTMKFFASWFERIKN